MGINKHTKEYQKLLQVYGSTLERWPISISEKEQEEIIHSSTYQSEKDLDEFLNQKAWPLPSANLRDKVMARCAPPIIMLIKRPMVFISFAATFLCFGLTHGLYYNGVTNTQTNYDYFSTNLTYTYGFIAMEDIDG